MPLAVVALPFCNIFVDGANNEEDDIDVEDDIGADLESVSQLDGQTRLGK